MKFPISHSGFTLLELLAAMAIFAIMSVMTFSGLSFVLDARDHLEAQRKSQQGLTLAFLRMEEDISQCRDRDIRLADGSTGPALEGREVDTRALGAPVFECTRGGMSIIGSSPVSDLQRIGYRLDDEQRLFRLVWPVLDRAPQTEPRSQQILANVENFAVRYHDGAKWHQTWPLPQQLGQQQLPPSLPKGVEIIIQQSGQAEINRVLRIND